MTDITIDAADGPAAARYFAPADAAAAGGVVLYMDAFGLRPALDQMAERIAAAGYHVVVPDLFYRFAPYGPFDSSAFSQEDSRKAIMTLIHGTTHEMTARDGAAFIAALRERGAGGPIATVGYCLGGGRALTAAARYPGDIVAAASFHGGNLASDAPDSPHLQAGAIKARVYVATAGVDQSFPPAQSARLAEALREGGVDHMIENYVGMQHGWTVPDSLVYDAVGAERHWKRLLNFLDETLR